MGWSNWAGRSRLFERRNSRLRQVNRFATGGIWTTNRPTNVLPVGSKAKAAFGTLKRGLHGESR